MRIEKISLVVVGFVLAFMGAWFSKAGAVREVKDGNTAPAFTLNNYDGKKVSLSDFKGKIIVVEWLNYECPFVKYHYEKAKTMINLANKYKDKNVVWVAINSTSHQETAKNEEFAKQFKIPYPILDDRDGKTGRAYGATRTPGMFIIDTKGNIVYSGAIDNSPMGKKTEGVVNYVDNVLGEVIAGKAVSVPVTEPYGCTVKYAK